MRRKLVLTTSNSTSKAAKAAVKTEVSRHGYDHFGIRFAPGDRPRWTGQAVRRPGLARQAHGPFELTFPDI